MKIVFLDSLTVGTDVDLSIFSTLGEFIKYETTSKDEVNERIIDADVVLTNKVLIGKEAMDYAKNLKLICITATGTNNVDLPYAKEKGIAVTNVAGYSTNSVVQHTFATLFYLLENLKYYDDYVKSGDYAKSPIFTHLNKPFSELKGKTYGIIGLGEIGRTVASIATAFGCKVIYYSTSGKNVNSQYTRVELDELLKESHIVSIHSPLNAATRGLLSYDKLKLMRKDAILINMGRGGIVDEAALAKILDEDGILGASLDVLTEEPITSNNPLLSVKNPDKLLITPHIAWASVEARERLLNEIVLNINAFFNGEIRNRVEL